jgi:hypothetical protein
MTFYILYSIFFVYLVNFGPGICVSLDPSNSHPSKALVRGVNLVVRDTKGRRISRHCCSDRGLPHCFVRRKTWLHLAIHIRRNLLCHFLWGYRLKVLIGVWLLCHCNIVTLDFSLQGRGSAHTLVLLRGTGLLRLGSYKDSYKILTYD